jgi:zinc/manganese transport system substrate-binding protein
MRDEGVCALFSETTVSDRLAQTVAAELDYCDTVQVLQLYTGALGPAGSGADTYRGMMQANIDTIVSGLR